VGRWLTFRPRSRQKTRDLTIILSGDLAVAHYFLRFTGIGQDQNWIRDTAVYKRDRDKWLIVHEHNSVPFDPETSKAVFEFK
jgi:ketosteroid isomerase-like protein